jgi:glycosyltransferase involved in cell wall biosynthesis
MKIAYDAKRFFHNATGLGNYSRDLIRILASHYPQNDYLLFTEKMGERGLEISKNPSVKTQLMPKKPTSRLFKMGRLAEAQHAQIFHGLSGELPLKWGNTSCKKVVTIHDLIFMRFPHLYGFLEKHIHFWKFKKAAQMADVVVAISEQTKQDIVHYLKIPESKIVVIYQGCHEAFKQNYNAEQKAKVAEKFKLPERFILNVGSIEERKNLFSVVKALLGTPIPLVVVGKSSRYHQKILAFIEKNKSQLPPILFLKNVDMPSLACLYQMADIMVYPSIFEGFGIPIIEALYSKTAVITSNLSCLPEAGGPHSTYINPHDVADIKAKIMHLWTQHSERNLRAERSYDFVQKFNDDVIAKAYQGLYEHLLGYTNG